MSSRFIRIYKHLDIDEIKKHLLLWGDLSGQCANCSQIGLKMEGFKCPQCQTEFNYLAFKNIKDHLPKIPKLLQERPQLVFVDYEDFKRISGALKAENFLK